MLHCTEQAEGAHRRGGRGQSRIPARRKTCGHATPKMMAITARTQRAGSVVATPPARDGTSPSQPQAARSRVCLVARMATHLTELAYGPQSRSGRGMSLPVSPDEEGVMSDNAVPCGTTPSCVNAVNSISQAKGQKKETESNLFAADLP